MALFSKTSLRNLAFRDPTVGIAGIGLFALGVATGAGLLLFLDPRSGRRRRSFVVDQVTKAKNNSLWYAGKKSRDFANRAKGLAAGASRLTRSSQPVDSQTLVDRVRSQMGRVVRHAKAIEVTAHDGAITLRGPILADEVDRLVACVHDVPGVNSVRTELDIHRSPDGIPSLQGEGKQSIEHRLQ